MGEHFFLLVQHQSERLLQPWEMQFIQDLKALHVMHSYLKLHLRENMHSTYCRILICDIITCLMKIPFCCLKFEAMTRSRFVRCSTVLKLDILVSFV